MTKEEPQWQMNVWRWLQTLWWMKPRWCNTVICLTALWNEAISKEVINFSRSFQIISRSKNPNTTVDWHHSCFEHSKALQSYGGWWNIQETPKLIEGSREAKWAHIAHLEATQDRSTGKSEKTLLHWDTRLALISRMDEEELVLW